MPGPDYEHAKQYVIQQLERKLPPMTYYHSVGHTRDDVLPAAQRLADMEGVVGEDRCCLLTAACYHDIGYIQRGLEHERYGARITAKILPAFGYTPPQIELIQRLIMATRLPTNPQTLLEKIIVDADMDSLGRDDFLKTSHALQNELAARGVEISPDGWYIHQLEFLGSHRYYTDSAKCLREAGKQRNVEQVRRLLAEFQASQQQPG
ncbi:MAG: HD domain-containing protein [Chloroflexi bacterium]|nr:HD domain-containing protein [Chloroflexota bacterium]